MGKRGPKPKPTNLKILTNTRADRVNQAEPPTVAGLPEPPEVLGPVARSEWERIAPMLAAMGILATIDGTALALYCQHYERWSEAESKLREFGLVCPTGTGSVKQSPYLTIAAAAMAAMAKILAEFGATPSSRSRVKTEKPPEEDEITAFLRKA